MKNRGAFVLADLEQVREPWAVRLARMVRCGQRSHFTGDDLTIQEWIDPRLTESLPLDFHLARALTAAWRAPEGMDQVPVVVLGVDYSEVLKARILKPDDWEVFGRIESQADTLGWRCRGEATSRRQTLIVGNPEAMLQVFGCETQMGDTVDVTITVGNSARHAFLSHLLSQVDSELAAEGVGVIAFIGRRREVLDPVQGGPDNEWNVIPARANHHMSGSFLSKYHAERSQRGQNADSEPWHLQEVRDALYKEACEYLQRPPTLREFQDILAESSPMRSIFPPHLLRFFPDVDRIFWCLGEPVWDGSSPTERFQILVDAAQKKSFLAMAENPQA